MEGKGQREQGLKEGEDSKRGKGKEVEGGHDGINRRTEGVTEEGAQSVRTEMNKDPKEARGKEKGLLEESAIKIKGSEKVDGVMEGIGRNTIVEGEGNKKWESAAM